MLPTVTKTVTGEENVAVRDTVHYNNVTPGKTYKVTGTLYEKVLDKNGKVTKKVFKDKNGTPVTAEANFTAEDSYGNVDVTSTSMAFAQGKVTLSLPSSPCPTTTRRLLPMPT